MNIKAIYKARGRILAAALFACCAGVARAGENAGVPPIKLGVGESIALAVKNNVTVKLAKARTEAGKARELLAASSFLPRLIGSVSQERTFRENLSAMGFNMGAIPSLIGPFNTFDARIILAQDILNVSAYSGYKSAEETRKAAELRQELASEQVAGAAVLAYVETLRSRKAIEAAEAGEVLARSLLDLADEKHRVGAATGLDVARARTRLSEEKLRVLDSNTSFDEASVRFRHILGLPLNSGTELVDSLVFSSAPVVDLDEALSDALKDRLELRIAERELKSDNYFLKAQKDARIPRISLDAQAAFSGNQPDDGAKMVGQAGVSLKVPFYYGGAIDARVDEVSSARNANEAGFYELKVQVEEDVRLALKKLAAAAERVGAVEETVALAENELVMARDRFAAGVGDNLELTNSQTVLSRARDSYVNALAGYHVLRVNLALARGKMRGFKF